MDHYLKQKIKFLQKKTFSADTISKKLNIPVESICEILEYPKDKDGRVAAHKDYNFYFHGMGDITSHRLEHYGLYLKEGDFEKWQPVCYMNKDSDEFKRLKEEAERIPKSSDAISEARRYWILMRFAVYQKDEWELLKRKFIFNKNRL